MELSLETVETEGKPCHQSRLILDSEERFSFVVFKSFLDELGERGIALPENQDKVLTHDFVRLPLSYVLSELGLRPSGARYSQHGSALAPPNEAHLDIYCEKKEIPLSISYPPNVLTVVPAVCFKFDMTEGQDEYLTADASLRTSVVFSGGEGSRETIIKDILKDAAILLSRQGAKEYKSLQLYKSSFGLRVEPVTSLATNISILERACSVLKEEDFRGLIEIKWEIWNGIHRDRNAVREALEFGYNVKLEKSLSEILESFYFPTL